MDMQFKTSYRPRLTDYAPLTSHSAVGTGVGTGVGAGAGAAAHNTSRGERERLDSITQLVSTITLVTQSIASAYRRETAEGDRLVECVVELSRRALAEVRAWPTRGSGEGMSVSDLNPMISHALSRAMNSPFAFAINQMAAEAAPSPMAHTPSAPSTDDLTEGRALLKSLTARELDMLRLIVKGMSNKEIAGQLHLTEGTVKGYVSHMLSKLNVSDRTQAALFAVRHGVEA